MTDSTIQKIIHQLKERLSHAVVEAGVNFMVNEVSVDEGTLLIIRELQLAIKKLDRSVKEAKMIIDKIKAKDEISSSD